MTLQRKLRRSTAGGSNISSLAYADYAEDSVDRSTYTFSSMGIGAADDDRFILVAVQGAENSVTTSYAPTSVTVGGQSATKLLNAGVQDFDFNVYSLWRAAVPTGTTGNVVVVWSRTIYNCSVATLRLIHATGTVSDSDTTAGSDPETTGSLTLPSGGVGLACGGGWETTGGPSVSHSWSGSGAVTSLWSESQTVGASDIGNSGCSIDATGTVTLNSSGDYAVVLAATWD